MIFIVPFTAFSLPIKAVLGLVFFVLMEVFFWVGSVIVGKQAISHFWNRFKKNKDKTGGPEVIATETPTLKNEKEQKREDARLFF